MFNIFFVLYLCYAISKDALSATLIILHRRKLHLVGAVALTYVLLALAHLDIAAFILDNLADALDGVILDLRHIVLKAVT